MMMDAQLPARAPESFGHWLLEPMRRNSSVYVKVGVAAVLINLFGLASSLFSMTVYDRVVPNDAMASLVGLSIGLGIIVVFDFVLRMLRAYFIDIAGAAIDHEVGDTLFNTILALRLDLQRRSDGALTGIMRELESLRDFFASATLTALVDLPFVLITLAVIAIVGGWVALVPLLLMPVVIGTGLAVQPAMNRLSSRAMEDGFRKQSVLVETIGALESVKASNAGDLLAKRWHRAVHAHSANSLRQRLVSVIAVTVASSANTIAYAGVIIVGVHMIMNHELTTGALVACSILSGRALAPLAQIAQLLTRVASTRSSYREVDTLMRTPGEGPGLGVGLKPARLDGRIEFRSVGFRYPGTGTRSLTDVSFAIEPGERVALLGRVGSGKSTVARLILGLYPPEEGSVLIDGSDVRQFDPAALRARIGAVTQDHPLFSGSIRDNILLDRHGMDEEEMLRVAELSGTHGFMGALANGYELKLANAGRGLSGGQRQAIAIARALVGSPSMLVLDEPTSAMDAQTEATLLERLEREVEGRTVVLVTHRPALLKLVNRVMVFDRGRLAADGPRDAVLQRLSGGGAKAA